MDKNTKLRAIFVSLFVVGSFICALTFMSAKNADDSDVSSTPVIVGGTNDFTIYRILDKGHYVYVGVSNDKEITISVQ
jgi:hypothetical protein